jgi:hypothetical protein
MNSTLHRHELLPFGWRCQGVSWDAVHTAHHRNPIPEMLHDRPLPASRITAAAPECYSGIMACYCQQLAPRLTLQGCANDQVVPVSPCLIGLCSTVIGEHGKCTWTLAPKADQLPHLETCAGLHVVLLNPKVQTPLAL